MAWAESVKVNAGVIGIPFGLNEFASTIPRIMRQCSNFLRRSISSRKKAPKGALFSLLYKCGLNRLIHPHGISNAPLYGTAPVKVYIAAICPLFAK